MPKPKKNQTITSEILTLGDDDSSQDDSYIPSDAEGIDNDSDNDDSTLSDFEALEHLYDGLTDSGSLDTSTVDSDSDAYSDSVFKVSVKTKDYDYDNPWHPPTQNGHSGSGFAVEYKGQVFFATNAHVASQNGRMEVRLANHAESFKAEALLIEHDCDLAILKVESPEFLSAVRPLPLGKLAKMRDKLTVHGFPMGGNELCVTEGKVSRMEVGTYVEAGTNLLQSQVSAEINPGNSGGPAIRDGKVVGVAFQGYDIGDGLGYIIPVPVIEHLLTEALDIENYKGFPDLNFQYQELKNKTLREYEGLANDETGILVKGVPKLSAARGLLKPGDVILAIDGHQIKNDGTCETSFSKRVELDYLISKRFIGEPVRFDIMRNRERMSVDVTLTNRASTTKKMQVRFESDPPTYFFMSGIALCPLTDQNYDLEKLIKFHSTEKKKPGDEIVFIKEVLACDHTSGYGKYTDEIVKKINGKRINNMRDAIKAVESNEGEFHLIETQSKHRIVVPNMTADEHKRLLKEFHVHRDRSRDLRHRPKLKPGTPEYTKAFLPAFAAATASASGSASSSSSVKSEPVKTKSLPVEATVDARSETSELESTGVETRSMRRRRKQAA